MLLYFILFLWIQLSFELYVCGLGLFILLPSSVIFILKVGKYHSRKFLLCKLPNILEHCHKLDTKADYIKEISTSLHKTHTLAFLTNASPSTHPFYHIMATWMMLMHQPQIFSYIYATFLKSSLKIPKYSPPLKHTKYTT